MFYVVDSIRYYSIRSFIIGDITKVFSYSELYISFVCTIICFSIYLLFSFLWFQILEFLIKGIIQHFLSCSSEKKRLMMYKNLQQFIKKLRKCYRSFRWPVIESMSCSLPKNKIFLWDGIKSIYNIFTPAKYQGEQNV